MKRWEIYLDIIMELLVILAGALLLIFVLPKAIVFLWPFVAGWIISMMAHPVIEYLEKKVKLPKKFGSAILIAAVITGIIVVLYFAVRGIALQVIGFIQDAPDIRHEIMRQGMIFQKKIEQFLSILPPSFGKQFDQWSGSIGDLFKKAASSAGDYGVAHAGGVAKGVTSGLVNLGGNAQVLGTKPDGSLWRVAVQSPDSEDEYLGVLETKDKAIITSGGYERYFEKDGVTYHHIIDPSTGYPADNGLISVTIVSADGTLADGLSTSLFVMGKDKATDYWKAHSDEFDMILLTDDEKLYVSEGIKDSFTSDREFEIVEK